MTECWRDIPEWEGLYQVSDHGRVRSVQRKVVCGRRHAVTRVQPARVISPYRVRSKTPKVALWRDGKALQIQVVTLVARAFGRVARGHKVRRPLPLPPGPRFIWSHEREEVRHGKN